MMARIPGRLPWWRRLLGDKTRREVAVEFLHSPVVQRARRQLRQADRLLAELEALEGSRDD